MDRSVHNLPMSGQLDKGIGTITMENEVSDSYMLPGTEALHEIYDLYIYRQADTEGVLNIFRIAKQFGLGLSGV